MTTSGSSSSSNNMMRIKWFHLFWFIISGACWWCLASACFWILLWVWCCHSFITTWCVYIVSNSGILTNREKGVICLDMRTLLEPTLMWEKGWHWSSSAFIMLNSMWRANHIRGGRRKNRKNFGRDKVQLQKTVFHIRAKYWRCHQQKEKANSFEFE